MSTRIDLPDHTYEALLRAASQQGITPEEWIASILNQAAAAPAHARVRRRKTSEDFTQVGGTDADADLIREYEARFGHAWTGKVQQL